MSISDNKNRIEMCRGSLFRSIIRFSFPLVISNMLQLMFNAADLIVVGHFSPHQSLAAVGSTGALTGLIINFFCGLSIGTNVLVANFFGAKNWADVKKTVHTSILISLIGGMILTVIGLLVAESSLKLMATPDDVLPRAATYMRIYFCGVPFSMLYNFGSAIMRAVGDTRRPLYYLSIAGIINVILNLLFVIVFHMDEAGVALATIISQAISAFLVIRALIGNNDCCRLFVRELSIDTLIFRRMLWIGLPAGIQSSFFCISNIIIQSSVNSFGSHAIAGNTACISIEGIICVCSSAFHITALSFAGQNLGAGLFDRVRKSAVICILCSVVICVVMGGVFVLFGKPLLEVYGADDVAIEYGLLRMKILFTTYAACGIMDVVGGVLRGLGHSIKPAVVTLICVCALRVVWVFTIFPHYKTMDNLMLSYPISWILTAIINGQILFYVCKKISVRTVGQRM